MLVNVFVLVLVSSINLCGAEEEKEAPSQLTELLEKNICDCRLNYRLEEQCKEKPCEWKSKERDQVLAHVKKGVNLSEVTFSRRESHFLNPKKNRKWKSTLLVQAAIHDDLEVAKCLLDQKADPGLVIALQDNCLSGKYVITPVMFARSTQFIDLLMKRGLAASFVKLCYDNRYPFGEYDASMTEDARQHLKSIIINFLQKNGQDTSKYEQCLSGSVGIGGMRAALALL